MYNEPMEKTGIKPAVIDFIQDAARTFGLRQVVLFGSRARGAHREKSDIDLALYGGDQTRFALAVDEEAPTLLQFDFVNMDGPVSDELKERVAQEGLVLYEEV